MIIDSPYRKDHHLEDYENIVLITRGISIAGILLYIRHMTYRRLSKNTQYEVYYRGMITRKLDVFWVTDHENQKDWATEWLLELQNKDSERVRRVKHNDQC
jgi:NAD(P)H-flavin reductase